MAQSGHKRPT